MADTDVLEDILSQLNVGGTMPPPTIPTPPAPPVPPIQQPLKPPVQSIQPPPPPAGGPAKAPNSQQSLRDKMLANNGGSAGPVVMEQTSEYKEENAGGNVNSTIIEADDDGADEKPKKGFNIKIVIGIAAVAVVLGLVAILSLGKKQPEAPPEEELLFNEPLPEDELVFLEPVTPQASTFYSADEMNSLRSIGLTGTEIEEFMGQNISYKTAYDMTMEKYWAAQLANQLPLMDMTSDEYYSQVSNTWLTLPERHDINEWTEENIAFTYNVKKNLDYEKVNVHGNQLFLKVYLDDNRHEKWFFLNVTPQEWYQLDESGNVVVDYTYTTHYKPYTDIFSAEEDTEDIFITAAKLNIINNNSSGF